tara:strand:- start:675 stop:1037 length:363 start_codon:yes stop_codon:yes gene_type:complete
MNNTYERITLMLIEASAFIKGKGMKEPRSRLAKMYWDARQGIEPTRLDISDRFVKAGEPGEKPTGDKGIDSIVKGIATTGKRRAGGMPDPARVSDTRKNTASEIIRRYGKEVLKRSKGRG